MGEFCPESTLCVDSYSVSVVARKRPWSFCQKCRWQITPKDPYTRDPSKSEWADCAAVQAVWESMCRCPGSVGIYQEMSSHATCQGTLGRSRLSPLSQAQATLHLKKKKHRRGLNCQTFSPNPHKRGKATTTPQALALPPAPQFLLFQLSTPIPIPSGALRL